MGVFHKPATNIRCAFFNRFLRLYQKMSAFEKPITASRAISPQAQPQLYGTSYFLVKMALTGLLLDNPYMFGYCYTQLTDVSVEQNGIYTFDRRAKFDLERLHQIQCRPAAFEQC